MHKINIFIFGPEDFVSAFNELRSYLKFNISSNHKDTSNPSYNNFHAIICHQEAAEDDKLINIVKKSHDCLKILATKKETKNTKNFDYLLKLPATISEINNIIEGGVAKKKFLKNSSITIKSYLLDKNEKKLIKDNISIILTEKEIQLLEVLLSKKKAVSKDHILSQVWHYSSESDTHTVETHIYRLRKKISDKFMDDQFILNSKEGYYL